MEWVATKKPGSWFLKLTAEEVEGPLDVVKSRLRVGETVVLLPPDRWGPAQPACKDVVLQEITSDWHTYTYIRNNVKGYGDAKIRAALDQLYGDSIIDLKQEKNTRKGVSSRRITTWYRRRLI